MGTNYIIENIRKMMKKFGISEDELAIKLQKETKALEEFNYMESEEAEPNTM